MIPLHQGFRSGAVQSLTLLFSQNCLAILLPQTFFKTLESVYGCLQNPVGIFVEIDCFSHVLSLLISQLK